MRPDLTTRYRQSSPFRGGPMATRRSFLSALAGVSASLPVFRERAITAVRRAHEIAGTRTPAALADNEAYWTEIQRAFDTDRTMVNLNNGGCSPAPTPVLEQMIRDLKFSKELPVYNMWAVLEPRLESVRRDLARDFGCDPEEMAVTRNASEANEIMIFGLDLKPGDEVIVTNQNYPRMLTSWRQRVRRDGIVLKEISFKVPPPSQQYLVDQFRAAITPRTRVIEVTHITNLTGQIMPVKELMDVARPLGIEGFVDGAHAYAHFPFTRDAIAAAFYGLTPLDSPYAGAICLFSVTGMDMGKLGGWLMDKYRIVTTPITPPEFAGVRITPT